MQVIAGNIPGNACKGLPVFLDSCFYIGILFWGLG